MAVVQLKVLPATQTPTAEATDTPVHRFANLEMFIKIIKPTPATTREQPILFVQVQTQPN
jgi:hypothetical protein